MIKSKVKITEEQDRLIIDNWGNNNSRNWIEEKVGLPYKKIAQRVKSLRYHGLMPKAKNYDNNLHKLLEENYISYYWLGFLLADGHFSKTGSIELSASDRDLDHILKYKNYFNIQNKEFKQDRGKKIIMGKECTRNSSTRIFVKSKFLVNELNLKHGITNRKTYECPKIDSFNTDYIESIFAGFLDGDGTIRVRKTNVNVSIQVYPTWQPFLEFLVKSLKFEKYSIYPPDKRGLITLEINELKKLIQIKEKLLKEDVPLMKRKWDKIYLGSFNLPMKNKEYRNKIINEISDFVFSNNRWPSASKKISVDKRERTLSTYYRLLKKYYFNELKIVEDRMTKKVFSK